MKNKRTSEFEEFDKIMGGLLAVPRAELQQKLEEEQKEKAGQKERRVTSSPASRASSPKPKKPAG